MWSPSSSRDKHRAWHVSYALVKLDNEEDRYSHCLFCKQLEPPLNILDALIQMWRWFNTRPECDATASGNWTTVIFVYERLAWILYVNQSNPMAVIWSLKRRGMISKDPDPIIWSYRDWCRFCRNPKVRRYAQYLWLPASTRHHTQYVCRLLQTSEFCYLSFCSATQKRTPSHQSHGWCTQAVHDMLVTAIKANRLCIRHHWNMAILMRLASR